MSHPATLRRTSSYRFDEAPPINDPSTPRIICRPTVLPIVRAALFTIACTTVSPLRDPPDPSTPPIVSIHPEPEVPVDPATPPAGVAPPPEATTFPFNFS